MKETVIYVVFAVLAVTLASFISYSPGDRWARGALGIILLASLVSPVIGIIGELGKITVDMPFFDVGEYEDGMDRTAEEAYRRGTCELVCQEFGFESSSVSVSTVGFSFSDMRAERIIITLSGRAITADSRALSEYVSGRLGCECEVNIAFE